MELNPSNTPCSCGSTDCDIDDDFVVCAECGEFVRDLTEDELDALREADAELASDRILEQQELEDFEGIGFEGDRVDDLENDGECYDFEGCCDE